MRLFTNITLLRRFRRADLSKGLLFSILFFILALSVVSCGNTKVLNLWKDPRYPGPPAKIVVTAVVRDANRRNMTEQEFVRMFRSHGVEAVTSRELLPEGEVPTRETVVPVAKKAGADLVLVVKSVSKDSVDFYSPQRNTGVPLDFTAENEALFVFPEKEQNEITYDYTVVVMQTTLYDLATEKSVWSASTRTKYQGSAFDQIHPFVRFIAGKLKSSGIIR